MSKPFTRAVIVALIIGLGIALLVSPIVFAIPPQPYSTYGTVKIDNENVAEGTAIEAFCSGDPTAYGSTTATIFMGESVYAIDVLGDDPETGGVKEGCLSGDTVTFEVNGLLAKETAVWASGASVELNLTAESPQPSIGLDKLTNELDTGAGPGPMVRVGDTVTWTYLISNTGNVALTNVAVVDDNGTPTDATDDFTACTLVDLATNGSHECTVTGVATSGQYTNTALATAVYTNTVSGTGISHYFGVDPVLSLEKRTNGQVARELPGVYVPVGPGQVVTWTFTVSNTGNVDLTGVVLTDDHGTPADSGDDFSCNIGSLVVDQVHQSCFYTDTVQSGQYTNTATVTGTPPIGSDIEKSDISHYFGVEGQVALLKATNGLDADTPPGPFVKVGDPVNWTYTVTNLSNVSLMSLEVTDNLVGPVINCTPDLTNTLPSGQKMTCSALGVAVEGQYQNIGTVTAIPEGGLASISDTNPSHYFGARPEMLFNKYTNGFDADVAPGPFIEQNGPVTWTFVITNTGNVSLTDILVTDNKVTGITCDGSGPLAPTAVRTCEATGISIPGQQSNQATVTATPMTVPPGTLADISEMDTSHYFGAGPAIVIEKLTNGQDADQAPGPYLLAPDPPGTPAAITWTFIVSNTGNVNLSNIRVSDDMVTGISCDGDSLTPNQRITCTATGTAEQGQHANLATVLATPEGLLEDISHTDPSHYFGANPEIVLEKRINGLNADASPGPYLLAMDPPGTREQVNWTFHITNTGNITLTNVQLSDNAVTGISCSGDGTLGPNEGLTCDASGPAQEGAQSNLATATGSPPQPLTDVTDNDPAYYFGANPSIQVEKATNDLDADTAPGPYILSGRPVTWTYVITNGGNVDLTNVTLTDDNGGQGAPYVCEIGSLAAGAADNATCSQSGSAGEGQFANLSTADGDFQGTFNSATVTDTDASHYFGAKTSVDIELDTNGADADQPPGLFLLAWNPPGPDPITWTFRITNTGNVRLENIQVTDTKPGIISCSGSTLEPQQGLQCEAFSAAVAGQQVNLGSVNATPIGGLPDVSGNDPSYYFGSLPELVIQKFTNGEDADTAPGPYILVGQDITWTYVVSNTGNITMTDIVVQDNKVIGIACDGDSLAPAERITCTAHGSAQKDQYDNLGTATGQIWSGLGEITESDPSHYFGAAPLIEMDKRTNGHSADSGTGPYILVGDTVTWTYVITNSGNVTLNTVVISDDNGTPGDPSDDFTSEDLGPLPAQMTLTLVMTGTAQENGYRNIGRVLSKPLIGDDLSAEDSSGYFGAIPELKIKKLTNGLDTGQGPGPTIEAGEPVTWTYVVSNTGNVALNNVVVWDDQSTPDVPGDDVMACDFGTLEPGSPPVSCDYRGVAVVKRYKNVGLAKGDPPGDLERIMAAAISHYFGFSPEPSLQLTKYVNGANADNAPGLYILAGDPISWTYEVVNTGNVSLTNVLVVDDNGTPADDSDDFECELGQLPQFAEVTCSQEGATAVEGAYHNLASVAGEYENVTVEDEDGSYYFGAVPTLSVIKMLNGRVIESGPGPVLTPGDPITWTYRVSNTGNITLTQVILIDDNGTPNNTGDDYICDIGVLGLDGPNEECQQHDTAGVGEYQNIATASGLWQAGVIVPMADSSFYRGLLIIYMPVMVND